MHQSFLPTTITTEEKGKSGEPLPILNYKALATWDTICSLGSAISHIRLNDSMSVKNNECVQRLMNYMNINQGIS